MTNREKVEEALKGPDHKHVVNRPMLCLTTALSGKVVKRILEELEREGKLPQGIPHMGAAASERETVFFNVKRKRTR
jgi:hypothetical protein